ncbi:hypothetical protein D3C84_536380 [compost metagenome]
MAPAIALSPQGRRADCHGGAVPVPVDGAADLRPGRPGLQPYQQCRAGAECRRTCGCLLCRCPVHGVGLLRLYLPAIAGDQDLADLPRASPALAVEWLVVLLAPDRPGVPGAFGRGAGAHSLPFGCQPAGFGRWRAGRKPWRPGQERVERAGQHPDVHCPVPVRPDRVYRSVLVQGHGRDRQDHSRPV